METARYRSGWEQARFMAHCALIPNTKKGFSPTDLVRFEWDEDTKPRIKPATNEDFERIRKLFDD